MRWHLIFGRIYHGICLIYSSCAQNFEVAPRFLEKIMHKSRHQNFGTLSVPSFNLRLATVLIDCVLLSYIFVLNGTGWAKNWFATKRFIPSNSDFINSRTKTSFFRKKAVSCHYLWLNTVTFFPEALRSLYNLSSTIGYDSLRVSFVDLANNLENGVLFED
jgi:hypothetical protein